MNPLNVEIIFFFYSSKKYAPIGSFSLTLSPLYLRTSI
jgi:hypothetical protein